MEDPAGEAHSSWERNAPWWDDRIGDGNAFQCQLIEPATLRLAAPGPGMRILDIACGAGRMARLMAAEGAQVTGIDFCEGFLDRARRRTAPEAPIDFRLLDVTDRGQLATLGAGRFQGAVATMALMDLARIDPLFEELPGLLEPGGFLVFSILHPCFSGSGTEMFVEERLVDGRSQRAAGLKVTHYRNATAFRAEGIRGQPEPGLHFHRSLETLLSTAFRCGFILDGLEEPGFRTASDRFLEWENMPDLAPVLVCRLKSHRPACTGFPRD
ncbi:bifunctional 2-polyprenyl-6-hydroxyphenol methylase/3-demethylubiquinol 3-O-methyltransferase UbiG [Geothrix sp. 21YS21S-2]|uniref:class I SAM-dependent methyltransferase n=1 Tax=Geothrix sp. 21YS21S-2 TaxID=3068893 RepID=UPI0027B98DE0|nr:class I SAM-dependent methyltransferase [Geothrix sp. 21YS21S-2]